MSIGEIGWIVSFICFLIAFIGVLIAYKLKEEFYMKLLYKFQVGFCVLMIIFLFLSNGVF